MKKKTFRTLNYRTIYYPALILTFFLIILVYYYLKMNVTIKNETYKTLRWDASYINTQMNSIFNTSVKEAHKAGYTSALQKILFSTSDSEKAESISISRELIASVRDQDDYILDLFFYSETGHLFTTSEYYKDFWKNMAIYNYDESIDLDGSFFSEYPIYDKDATFFFFYTPIHKTTPGIVHKTNKNALCAILCNYSDLCKNAQGILPATETVYVLYNDRIISSVNRIEGLDGNALSQYAKGELKLTINNQKYYSFVETNDHFKIICMEKADLVASNRKIFDKTFFLILTLAILSSAVILLLLNKNYSKQTNIMIRELNSMTDGSAKLRVTVPKMSELEDIATEINRMLDRLEESAERETQATNMALASKLAQKDAEMMAYRSQINPHFFFNTLECVRSMAQYYSADMIEEIVSAMSKMFRYSLYSENVVPLSAEIDILDQYFTITNFRFPDKYTILKEIDPETLDTRVPSMILQPLVENCIKHAFPRSGRTAKNIVTVKSALSPSGQLLLTVCDNGQGMSPEILEKIQHSLYSKEKSISDHKDSIGINNIYERILLFNKDNRMEFASKENEYTSITLILNPIE